MTDIGKTLQNARNEKHYTLDDLQQITKIQKRYLIAIEENNFDALPGDFYVRAFIRQYADTVGIKADKLLSELDKSNIFESQVAIKLLPQADFYEAEEYHQEYYKKNKLHYKAYRRGSGRAPFLEKIWTQDNINKLNEILSKLQ